MSSMPTCRRCWKLGGHRDVEPERLRTRTVETARRQRNTVDSPTRAYEAAAGGSQGGAPPTGELPQRGAHAGRRVSERQGRAPGPSVGERSQTAAGPGPAAEDRGIASRRVSTVPAGLGAPAAGAAVQQLPPIEEAPAGEMQPEASRPRRLSSASPGVSESPSQDRVFRVLGLPWLTAEENARRVTMDGRLEQVRESGGCFSDVDGRVVRPGRTPCSIRSGGFWTRIPCCAGRERGC